MKSNRVVVASLTFLFASVAMHLARRAVCIAEPEGAAPRVWVVAIGVSKYTRNYQALRGAADGARQVSDALHDAQPATTTAFTLTTDAFDPTSWPNKENVVDVFSTLARKVGPSDRVVFYFCGHGIEAEEEQNGKKVPQQYLLLMNVGNLADPEARDAGSLKLSWVRDKLESLRCKERLVWLDACRETLDTFSVTGGEQGSSPMTQSFQESGKLRGAGEGDAVTFFGCRAGEKVYHSKRGPSFFTEALVEGLTGGGDDGTGRITMSSLAAFVRQRVPDAVKEENPALEQHPELFPAQLPSDTLVLRPAPGSIACPRFPGKYGALFANKVVTRLAQSREVNLVERPRLDAALAELKLAEIGLTDVKTAQKLGEMVNARYVLIGDLDEAPGNQLSLTTRLVEVATGRQVPGVAEDCTVNPEDQNAWEPKVRALTDNLLKSMREARIAFPRVGVTLSAFGSLRVESDPPGADVYVGGAKAERVTPLTVTNLKPGKVTVLVTRDGFADQTKAATIVGGQTATLKVELPALQGAITVKSSPVGARVTVDGEERGATTAQGLVVLGLGVGTHTVAVKLDKFRDWTQDVRVANMGNKEVKADLTGLPGKVVVSSTPRGATVYVDGKDRGKTLLTLNDLEPGRHTVKVVMPGYETQEQTLTLDPAGEEALTLTLKETEKAQIEVNTDQTKTNPTDGAEMVYIPEGEFTMGSNDYDDEKPPHKVSLDGYWIYKYEVTVGQYRKFCQATNRKIADAPSWGWRDDHPIVNVTWNDAKAYCDWAGVQLPSEAEWEYAARGGRQFEYGTSTGELSHDLANYSGKEGRDQWENTSPVGSFPANPFGLHDMAGNVWEWCQDWYDGYPGNNKKDDNFGQKARVLRGGSWGFNDERTFRCSNRYRGDPVNWDDSGGFRCLQGP